MNKNVNEGPVVLVDFHKVTKTDKCILLGWSPYKTTDKWPMPISNRVFFTGGGSYCSCTK